MFSKGFDEKALEGTRKMQQHGRHGAAVFDRWTYSLISKSIGPAPLFLILNF